MRAGSRLVPVMGIVILGGVLLGGGAFVVATAPAPPTSTTTTVAVTTSTTTAPAPVTISTTTSTTFPTRRAGEVPGWTIGQPWGTVSGVTMFRGNPTRTWYGTGPIPPSGVAELWRYPDRPMCGQSTAGGETKLWCGTGWTGQPVVWEREDGVTEVIVGAYDRAVHFVDAATGLPTRAPFLTGDLVKGSVTLDPDGFPLLYFGSRDNKLRGVALDRDPVAELWSFDAGEVPGIWNNDWDGNPVVVDDVMYEGGENGWIFAFRLNRGYRDGLVTIEPEVLFQTPGWTDELVSAVGPNVSIESSMAVWGDRAYFANSGGRVVGLDVSAVEQGEAPVVFDYWMGDDVDATIVIDAEGSLYVAAEYERRTDRSREVGQLTKLDPFAEDDPRVWGIEVLPDGPGDGGLWATPALHAGHLYASTHTGRLLAVDTFTGQIVWEDTVGPHAWSSPVVVDETLVVATCGGELRAYDLSDPAHPELLWTLQAAEACIESTPAVWEGRVYVGSRDGYLRAYGG